MTGANAIRTSRPDRAVRVTSWDKYMRWGFLSHQYVRAFREHARSTVSAPALPVPLTVKWACSAKFI